MNLLNVCVWSYLRLEQIVFLPQQTQQPR